MKISSFLFILLGLAVSGNALKEDNLRGSSQDEETKTAELNGDRGRRLQSASSARYAGATGSERWGVFANWQPENFAANQSPLLQGFNFDFHGGSRSIDTIGVYTYSTGAWAFFKDRDAGEDFDFYAKGIGLPEGSTISSMCGNTNTQGEAVAYGPSGSAGSNPVILHGWSVDYVTGRGDHPIKSLGVSVRNEGGTPLLELKYGDQNPDTVVRYCVQYAIVPENKVLDSGSFSGDSSDGSDSAWRDSWSERTSMEFGRLEPVITGFSFEFHNTDHHLDKLRVDLDPHEFNVLFADVSFDDNFDPDGGFSWSVDYALVVRNA